MGSMELEGRFSGTKIRRWQDNRAWKSLSKENPESFDCLMNNGAVPKSQMQLVTDNMIKRSQHSTNDDSIDQFQVDGQKYLDSQSITMISRVVPTLSTPKRYHCASIAINGETDNVDQVEKENSPSSSAFLSTDSAAFALLKDEKQENLVPDSDMTMITPILDQTSSVNEIKVTPPQPSEGSIIVSTDAIESKAAAYSLNGGHRNESFLPKSGATGSNSSTSLRNRVVSKSKKHSSRTNLYIRGLPKSISEKDLISLVPDASAIRSVKLVVNNDEEGYGFIDFVSNEAALIAMQHIKIQNSSQYVNFAYESEKDPLNIYVTNIPESWNSDSVENLKQIFAPYGKIASALVMTRRSKNTCTGTGFVRYLTSEEAERAIDGIRKAKIILPGAKRPLELKLADRQRSRDHKSESMGLGTSTLPLFHQFMGDETQQNFCQAQKSRTYSAPRVENIFNVTAVPDCTMFEQANTSGFVTSGAPFLSPGSIDIASTSSDENLAPPQFTTSVISPVTPVAAAAAAATATALAAPLFQFPCIPWIQQDPLSTHGVQTPAFIHPQLAATAVQKAAAATATLNLSSLATAYQMANLGVFNYGALAPAQPFNMVFPFVNEQLSAHPIDAANLYSFGLNQPLWPKASFYG